MTKFVVPILCALIFVTVIIRSKTFAADCYITSIWSTAQNHSLSDACKLSYAQQNGACVRYSSTNLGPDWDFYVYYISTGGFKKKSCHCSTTSSGGPVTAMELDCDHDGYCTESISGTGTRKYYVEQLIYCPNAIAPLEMWEDIAAWSTGTGDVDVTTRHYYCSCIGEIHRCDEI